MKANIKTGESGQNINLKAYNPTVCNIQITLLLLSNKSSTVLRRVTFGDIW